MNNKKTEKISRNILLFVIFIFVIIALILTVIKEKTGSLDSVDQFFNNNSQSEVNQQTLLKKNNNLVVSLAGSKVKKEVFGSLKNVSTKSIVNMKEAERLRQEEEAKKIKEEEVKAKSVNTSIATRDFQLNGGKYVKGSFILNIVKSDPNGLKLWSAFNNEFGPVIADTAAISLYFENGSLKTDSVGVCNRIHWINGDYRNCAYADMNSNGMDAGLKQINTFYQAQRITKLGGEPCNFVDSKDRNDPCNQKKISWLLNIDNNIKISLDIYREQGFGPWYGYKKAFK